jgi:hypothetical protein
VSLPNLQSHYWKATFSYLRIKLELSLENGANFFKKKAEACHSEQAIGTRLDGPGLEARLRQDILFFSKNAQNNSRPILYPVQ